MRSIGSIVDATGGLSIRGFSIDAPGTANEFGYDLGDPAFAQYNLHTFTTELDATHLVTFARALEGCAVPSPIVEIAAPCSDPQAP